MRRWLMDRLNLCTVGWKCPHCGLKAKASKRGLVDFLEPWHRDRCWMRPENVGKRWSEALPKL